MCTGGSIGENGPLCVNAGAGCFTADRKSEAAGHLPGPQQWNFIISESLGISAWGLFPGTPHCVLTGVS